MMMMMTMTKLMSEKSMNVLFWPQALGTSVLPSSPLALGLHSRDNRKQEWKLEAHLRIIYTGR